MNGKHWSLLVEGIKSCLEKVCFKVAPKRVYETQNRNHCACNKFWTNADTL